MSDRLQTTNARNLPHMPIWVAIALLVLIGAASRFLGLAPNLTAVGAVALFAGWLFPNRLLAIAVPCGAMFLGDLVIGFYEWRVMLVVYAALAAPIVLSRFLGVRPAAWRIALGGVAATTIFFVATNFAVWAFGHGYERTGAGLAACYAAAVPFVKYQLVGDVGFSLALFGIHAWLTRPHLGAEARQAAPVAA